MLDHSFRPFHIFYLLSHFFLFALRFFHHKRTVDHAQSKLHFSLSVQGHYTFSRFRCSPTIFPLFFSSFFFYFDLLCLSPWLHVPSIIYSAFLLNSSASLPSQYKAVLFSSVQTTIKNLQFCFPNSFIFRFSFYHKFILHVICNCWPSADIDGSCPSSQILHSQALQHPWQFHSCFLHPSTKIILLIPHFDDIILLSSFLICYPISMSSNIKRKQQQKNRVTFPHNLTLPHLSS